MADKNKNPAEPRLCGVLSTTSGGDGGIRTLDPGFGPDAPLAGECLRPLGHVSQTFGRAGSQRDEAKIIAGRTTKVNVSGTLFVPDSSPTTQILHIRRADGTKRKWGTRERPTIQRKLRLIQLERLMQRAHGELHILLVDQHRDLDL